MTRPMRVFVSYAWEDDEYRLTVKKLAARLRDDGVDAQLDTWHARGASVPDFMTRELRLADKIVVVCSPTYRRHVHDMEEGRGHPTGVGWEATLMKEARFNGKLRHDQLVVILLSGTREESVPDFLLGYTRFDLSDCSRFEERYRLLMRELAHHPESAPPLGELPLDLQHDPHTGTRSAAGAPGTRRLGTADSPAKSSFKRPDTNPADHFSAREVLIGVLCLLGTFAFFTGGVALSYALLHKAPAAVALVDQIFKLDKEIDAARAQVHEHALALSQLQSVRSAVAADAVAVSGVRRGGIPDFASQNGDTLKLSRVVTGNNWVEELISQPDGTTPATPGEIAGRYTELIGDQIMVREVVKVVPIEHADRYLGFVSVGRSVTIASAVNALVGAGVTGKLVINGKTASIGQVPEGARTHEWSLSSDGTKIIARELPPCEVMGVPMFDSGLVALAIFLLSFLTAWSLDGFGRYGAMRKLFDQDRAPRARDDRARESVPPDTAAPKAGDDGEGDDDGEWEEVVVRRRESRPSGIGDRRELCADGSCKGGIGPDRVCSICGRARPTA